MTQGEIYLAFYWLTFPGDTILYTDIACSRFPHVAIFLEKWIAHAGSEYFLKLSAYSFICLFKIADRQRQQIT